MPSGRAIPSKASPSRDAPAQAASWTGTPRAEDVLARDLAECSDDEDAIDDAIDSESDVSGDPGPTLWRRPSGVAYGTSRPVMNYQYDGDDSPILTRIERKQSRDAERSLLRDNHILPPKHPERHDDHSLFWRIYSRYFSTKTNEPHPGDDEGNTPKIVVQRPDESTPLLVGEASTAGGLPRSEDDGHEHLDEHWEAAVASGALRTTWQRETKTIIQYALPLVVTFFLQYSINVVAVFAVGKIGRNELGAVSLAAMTATITCYAPLQGLATSLDTLCAQAYGSGHRHLVGLQLQRMIYFLLLAFIPIAVLWFHSETVLNMIIPEPITARLTGQYLRVLIFGGPAFICFESGKRFVQAQGLFQATTWTLLIVFPINVFVNWLLVWKLELGYIGAPIAVAISQNLLPIFLLLYVRFVNGYQCWGGFSRRAFSNWGVMLRLALPGMIMILAEYAAFELLTLFSSRFGPSYLAAQSVLVTVTSITYQIPFPVSIAASTRIANLIGAGLVEPAKTTALVATAATCLTGLFNLVVFLALRYQIPWLFTNDAEVVELVAGLMPIVSVMQVLDALSCGAGGLLRGIGRPSVGGYANLLVYYTFALPISFVTAFALDMKLTGLWLGVTLGLALVAIIEYSFVYMSDWQKAARDAERRNAAG